MGGLAGRFRLLRPSVRPTLWREFLLVYLVALGVRLLWAAITPPWAAPDELSHFTYVAHIVENEEIPHAAPYGNSYTDLSLEVGESCGRTLCDRISGLWTSHERELQRFPLDFDYGQARLQNGDAERRKSQSGSSASGYPAFYYLFLALFYKAFYWSPLLTRLLAVRCGSALVSALGCCFGYLVAHEIRQSHAWGRAVGLTMALAPMPAFMGGVTNNDAAMFTAASALCWLIARAWRKPTFGVRQAAVLGLSVGFVLWSKLTAAPLVLCAAALVAWRAFPVQTRPLRCSWPRVKALLACAGCVLAIDGPWLVYQRMISPVATMNATSEGEAVQALLGPGKFSFAHYLHSLIDERGLAYFQWLFGKSFWALFGWQEIALSELTYGVLTMICVVAIIGVVARVYLHVEDRPLVLLMSGLVLAQVVFLFVVFDYVMGYATTGHTIGLQGRYFLPAFAPLLFVLISGLSYLSDDHPVVLRAAPLAMLGLQAASLARMLEAYAGVVVG